MGAQACGDPDRRTGDDLGLGAAPFSSEPVVAAARHRRRGKGTVALLLIAALGGIGAAPAEPSALCLPLLMTCDPGTSTPAPPPIDVPGLVGNLLGGATDADPATPVLPVIPVLDPNAPTFTLPAAQLGGSSISFTGLRAVSVVLVRLVDGTEVPVIKLMADDIVIDDFLLDVRRATGPSLVSNATRMELKGNVQVYVDSLTATLLGGVGISLLAPTPPPGNELPPQLLRVNLGLVGVTAESISFTASHQHLEE